MPAEGGDAVQLTRGGGRVARESVDGRDLYFAKPVPDGYSLWRMSSGLGEESRVLDSVLAFCWDVTKDGIYYEDRGGADGLRPTYFYAFATRRSTPVAGADLRGGDGLAVSADGTTLLATRSTEIGADLMVLEKFR